MAIEYLGLSSINGPLIVLEGVQDAFFDEIVEFVVNGNERKLGRIIEIYEDKAVIQVFEGTENMSLLNTHTKLTGHPMEIALSPDMLGRTFSGIGQPIDDLGPISLSSSNSSLNNSLNASHILLDSFTLSQLPRKIVSATSEYHLLFFSRRYVSLL